MLFIALLTACAVGMLEYDEYFVGFDDKKGPGYAIGLAMFTFPCAVAWAGVASSLAIRLFRRRIRTVKLEKSQQ